MADKTTKSGIYCIRNALSGRIYVGSAVKLQRRWYLHCSLLRRGKHHSQTLQRSWFKHGPSAFSFEVLEIIEDRSQLVEREQHWIDALNSTCPRTGYNIAPKAGTSLGRKHPPEVRALMSAQRLGRKLPPRTAEHRANLSASRIGNQWSRGHRKTDEAKAKMSAAKKGKSQSRESNLKRSLAMKGRKLPPRTKEHSQKISDAAQARRKRMMGVLGQLELPLS